MSLLMPIGDPCAFCDYLAGNRPYTLLTRDNLTATLVTREQRGQGHLLIIPIEHRPTILELTPEEDAAMMKSLRHAAKMIISAFKAEGIAVWQNNGTPAFQRIPHAHFHIAGTFPGGGTEHGKVPELSIDETDVLAKLLLAHK